MFTKFVCLDYFEVTAYSFYKKRKRDFDQDLCDVSTECKIQKTNACVEIKVQLISVYKPPFVLYLACTK